MARIIRGCSAWGGGRLLAALSTVLLLVASPPLSAAGIQIVDDTGARFTLTHPAQRIVSLAPGATEMLFAAGAGSKLLATVAYADQPDAARRLPRIGDSNAIDMERLLVLKPDVVVYWPGGNNPAQIAQLRRLGFTLYGQQVDRLAQLGASLRRLGRLAGTEVAAQARAAQLEQRLHQLTERYSHATHLTVLLETWNQPLYTVGGPQLMSDVLGVCGATNVFGDLPQLSPAVQVEAVIARDPEVIIAAAPPGAGAQWLQAWRQFPALRAVRRGNLLDFQDQALSRLGPSVLDAATGLCALLDAARSRR
ncbi:MAG TPA: cobalamin-binding protein [Steroidobacteraceae bacterium]|jgi:iron complex transport system substrate-binding protein